MERCKQHRNLTIIQRVFIENVVHVSGEEPSLENNDWYSDPALWHDPQPVSITITCSDCGFERIYKPEASIPKWVRTIWRVPKELVE